MTTVAQLVGLLAMGANILAFQFKSKRNIIFSQLVGSALFAVNMFMLHAILGGILNIVGIIRAIVYINKDKLKVSIKVVNIFFILLYIFSYILVFTVFGKEPSPLNFVIEILPIVGMSAMTLGLSGTNARTIRIVGFINSPCWLIYGFVNFSIGGILCEVFSIASATWAYLRLDLKDKNQR